MKKLLLSGLFSLLMVITSYSQIEKFQAVYIYNITRYIEWPAEYKSGNFVIGILGNNAQILPELVVIQKTKNIMGQTIEIREFANSSAITQCHILFVPATKTSELSSAIAKLAGSSTLVITDSPGAINKGAAINFILKDNKLSFELKKDNAIKRNIKISSALEGLASTTY